MSTVHIGKIGRLPREIREQLSQQLEEGIPNKELVVWLNGLEDVEEVLRLRFGGRAITEQNLSEWKQTGHAEWLRREERRALALQLTEPASEEDEESAGEQQISDRLARTLALEMARLAMELVEQDGDTESRWKRLCGVYQELAKVRCDDHRAERLRLQREKWEHELELEAEAADAKQKKAERDELVAACFTPMKQAAMAEAFGGGLRGRTMAELLQRIQRDEPVEEMLAWAREKSWNDEARMTNGAPKATEMTGNPSKSD